MLEYNLSARSLLGRPKSAIYAAAGADLSGFHATIHAERALFVCDYRETVILKGALTRLKDEGKYLLQGDTRNDYSESKRLAGYAPYFHLNSERKLAIALITELQACGGEFVSLHHKRDVSELTYSLPSDDRLKSRSIHSVFFVNKKLEHLTREDVTETIGCHVDVYHHRAAMELPSRYPLLGKSVFPMILKLLSESGLFVTDDIGIDDFYNNMVDFSFSFPEVSSGGYELSLAGLQPNDALIPNHFMKSLQDKYGRCLRMRRKILCNPLKGASLPTQ